MGVFLSKPSTVKFSEDGEDDDVRFGVSSMQGWRKNMEDAHLAVLDLRHPSSGSAEGKPVDVEGCGAGAAGNEGAAAAVTAAVRLFGVFDGHGGKEVALFVQEHIAAELVKLDEYKGGDFPGALTRSFHRMDEMLEVAAKEMRRRREPPGGGTEYSATAAPSEAGSREEEGGDGGTGDGMVEDTDAPTAAAMMEQLTLFRSRRNPSDMEHIDSSGAESTSAISPKLGRPSFMSEKADDGEDAPYAYTPSILQSIRSGPRSGGETPNPAANSSPIMDSNAAGPGRGGRGERVKMSDALELFSRILNIHQSSSSSSSSSNEDGSSGNASNPLAIRTAIPITTTITTTTTAEEKRSESSGYCAPSAPLENGGGVLKDAHSGSEDKAEEGGHTGYGEGAGAGNEGQQQQQQQQQQQRRRPEGENGEADGWSKDDAQEDAYSGGVDTFGDEEDSEDSEDDDDVVRVANGVANAGGAPRSPLGNRANSLASMMAGAQGPTCQLEDHPIQAGCTSVVCLMVGKTLHVANAGDSRAVMCRGGKAVDLSKDHKPLADTEKNRIEGAGGFVNGAGRVNGNLNLSRSIGDLKYKANDTLPPADQMITAEPDVQSVEVTDQDRFVILACDGVWDCMSSQECVDFVAERVGKMSLSKVCEAVMDKCLSEDPRRTAGIGGDNMTCLVVLLDKGRVSEQGSSSAHEESEGKIEGQQDGRTQISKKSQKRQPQ